MKNRNDVNPLLHALLPIVVVTAYVLIGFLFDRGWALGWLLFFIIPIVESFSKAIKRKKPSDFAYPLLVVGAYLAIGMLCHVWHPTWVMFFTIPAFYAICDAITKTTMQNDSVNNSENSENTLHSGNTTAIIITIIVSIAVVCIVAIVCSFAWLGGAFDNIGYHNSNSSSLSGSSEVSADSISNIDIEWISGDIDIIYYDGDKISFTETASDCPLSYEIDGDTLCIDEYKGNVASLSKAQEKDLTVKIPNGFEFTRFNLDIVSASFKAEKLNTSSFDVETVSGDINVSFINQPHVISIESVSSNANITLPDSTSGYNLDFESVSGNFNNNGNFEIGDAYTQIDFESVSGNLDLERSK